MRKSTITKINLLLSMAATTLLISGCGGFFDKDNTPVPTPLTQYKPEVTPRLRWSASIGGGAGSHDYLKLNPAIANGNIYTSSTSGYVSAINANNGKVQWQVRLPSYLSTGPGVGDGLVVVANHTGNVFALDQTNGQIRWQATANGNVIASPAVGQGLAVIKTVNGITRAYSTDNGSERWNDQQTEPNLLLRGSSTPIIQDQALIVGFANGSLVKYSLDNGEMDWLQSIAIPKGAFAIQRMIDIDANPLVLDHHIYAATYQGNIASLDWSTGKTYWSRDISSYTGMAATSRDIFITDASGHVFDFDTDNGETRWQQDSLANRVLSSPAIQGHYVVVGDASGYLHWLNQSDGRLSGRIALGSTISADPIAWENTLFVLTKNGTLSAYSVN